MRRAAHAPKCPIKLSSATKQLDSEITRTKQKPDIELGSLATRDFTAVTRSPHQDRKRIDGAAYLREQEARRLSLAQLNEHNARLSNSKHSSSSKPQYRSNTRHGEV